jgi:hypothetical protein
MMSYVYAVTDRPDVALQKQLGLGDEALARVVFRDIGAVVSAHGAPHVSASTDKVWRHERVVESLMSAHAVLPMRFGTLLASFDEVESMLRRGYPQFIKDIARVRDHVEVGLRFLTPLKSEAVLSNPATAEFRLSSSDDPAQSATAPGTAYLQTKLLGEQERRDRRRAELELVRKTYRILAEHATASKLDDDTAVAPTFSAAFLVHRDGLASFGDLVSRLADADRELALLCTGPWPAYSFVSAHPSQSTQRTGS